MTEVKAWRILFPGDGSADAAAVRKALADAGLDCEVRPAEDAAETLYRGEQYFRSLIENASDLISIMNPDGTVRYLSPSCARVLGYEPEELIGKQILDHIHPDDLPLMKEQLEYKLEHPGVVIDLTCRFRHKDGTWRVLEGVSVNLLDDPSVAGILTNSRDVTDRRQAEALEAVQRRFLEMVAGDRPLFEMMDFLARSIEGQSDGALCSILLLDPDENKLRFGSAPS
ncbi:MAG: PAS domain-containing protein, partial [Pyrinomonadaceae bacterium]